MWRKTSRLEWFLIIMASPAKVVLAAATLRSEKKWKGFPLLMITILLALFVGLQSGCVVSLFRIMLPAAATLNQGWMRSMVGEDEKNFVGVPTEQEERYHSPAALDFGESEFYDHNVINVLYMNPNSEDSGNGGKVVLFSWLKVLYLFIFYYYIFY